MGTKHSWSPQNNCFVPPNSVYKHKCWPCKSVLMLFSTILRIEDDRLRSLVQHQKFCCLCSCWLKSQAPCKPAFHVQWQMIQNIWKKGTLYVKYCTESSRNGFFVNKTSEFNMMYALLWNKTLKVAEMVYLYTKLVNLTWFTHFCRWSHLSRFTRFWGDQPWP